MVLGSYFARFVGESIDRFCRDAQIPDGDILGKIVRYLIMAFIIMIALSQIEVGGDIVQRAFLIILAGIVLALALAFGLGGKEWAHLCSNGGGRAASSTREVLAAAEFIAVRALIGPCILGN